MLKNLGIFTCILARSHSVAVYENLHYDFWGDLYY